MIDQSLLARIQTRSVPSLLSKIGALLLLKAGPGCGSSSDFELMNADCGELCVKFSR